MSDTVCLGIDPGLARVGYGAVAQSGFKLRALNYGCIETSPKMSFTERLLRIYDELQTQIKICKPDFVSVERLFFGHNVTTAEYVFQARGVVMLLAAQNNLPVVEPKPNQIKLALCGTGDAVKSQVQGMVQRFLALDEIPKPDDTADALAAAITGFALKIMS
ncbi:MAG: crossover junction endodeoxyribonuclease RuvC [Synergistales bacterium]|nr:crossover junction endodeoxyribonuclease RuvC [Synergistales bacterium]MDY6401098.1 crossover junction endodeoxyribonuclease RuvC [Synergistales bacterium]MDY6404691.1 crossover junction endodeoxyribonuclease RuvC [Synergistales bacterium]MDY6410893.1 crossover junction endodeoxyribonuclease RuvC [Synergistales bacterium]MDY6415136.1 crossover junction endodeoxyribonuclease RuvC [Synergistales bacterium]